MEKYSFKNMLSEKILIETQKNDKKDSIRIQKIEIPMIQRDYAQGRDNEFEVRNRFLNVIFQALKNDASLEMDFVYGSFYGSNSKKTNVFIPLDGQQRLTTLFLLYWYIGSRELDLTRYEELKCLLKKFTYETRVTSRRFCEGLVEKTRISFNYSPGSKITNLSWFYNSYKKDPTVTSMLNMLDAIHEKYNEVRIETKSLFDNLEKLQFYLLPLDGFDLTEELYVKMNARGKQLTDFENLKADLINWMKDENNYGDVFQATVVLNDRELPYYMAFSEKMDIFWTDFFWTITKDYDPKEKDKNTGKRIHPEGKIVDPLFMRFFRRYLCNLRIATSNLTVDEIENKDDIFRYFYGREDDDADNDDSFVSYKSFDNYAKLLNYKVIKNIEKILDCISSSHTESIQKFSQPSWDPGSFDLFGKSVTQRQRVAFFAVTIFIETNGSYSENAFKAWMRFVWNIIIDPDLRSIPIMIRAVRFIAMIAKHSENILGYLANFTKKASDFSVPVQFEEQFKEECLKAKLILDKNNDWEKEIIAAETHPLFKGNIRFLLLKNEHTSFKTFKKYKQAAFKIFENNDFSDSPANYLWIRATLSKSDKINLPIKLSNGRFDNWRSLINFEFIEAFRKVLDEVMASDKSAEEILNDICNNYQRDTSQIWIYPLVRWVGENGETLLGNYSETRMIKNYGNDPEQIYLFNKTRWTEGNIILSNYRNEIIAELIKKLNIECDSNWLNIQGRFFRGWNIIVKRMINAYVIEYHFDNRFVTILLKASEVLKSKLDAKFEKFESGKKAEGWFCFIKRFDYQNDVQDESEIVSFIEKIDNEVFNEYNCKSLYAKRSFNICL